MSMQRLSIAGFPLDGIRLIEASAGTGKTWTIAGLYLRLLLERGLSVTDILVVTFTEAATQELRGRIRARLRDALRVMEGRLEDAVLKEALAGYLGDEAVLQQLRDAVTRMDEAAIYTIHGFCQRMLTDNAFESGSLFEAEFVTEVNQLRQQAIRDFWRREVAAASPEKAAWVLREWPTADSLLKAIDPLLVNSQARTLPEVDHAREETLQGDYQQACRELASLWEQEKDEVVRLLLEAEGLGRAEKTYRPDQIGYMAAGMDTFSERAVFPLLLPHRFELLTPRFLEAGITAAKAKKGVRPPVHTLFELAGRVADINQALTAMARPEFLRQAADFVSTEITRSKREQRILFFDDLLDKLDQGLKGAGGEALARRIRSLHPVAMIDEFQDTDPRQYSIFHTIYAQPGEEHGNALFMIGDPKQAIYSFRGADVFTYMQARHDTDAATSHFTLDTNYRSTPAVVASINALFGNPALPPFLYPGEIDFQPVVPGVSAEAGRLRIEGKPVAPLKCWFLNGPDDRPVDKGEGRRLVAHGCAAEIAELLDSGRQGRATIGDSPVCAADIAVLVRNRQQAMEVRSALSRLGIGSVFISRDSVFGSEEASHFARVLLAVAEPGNTGAVLTALATRLFGYTADHLQGLAEEGPAWEGLVQQFRDWQQQWQREGFMAMFRALLRQSAVARRLLTEPEGERRLTNYLQLAELAQQASLEFPGIEGVLRWLAEARANPRGEAEEQQLRMESEENLVQIVTVHKSKGLQYNLVFLPFLWDSREEDGRQAVVLAHDETSRELLADLGSNQRDEVLRQARKERLAEDLRLLYVALTRARYRNYFAWGRFRGAADSALAYLLHPLQHYEAGGRVSQLDSLDDAAIRQRLEAFEAGDEPLVELASLPEAGRRLRPETAGGTVVTLREPAPVVAQTWTMTSFSGLTHAAHERGWQVDLPDHDQLVSEEAEPSAGVVTDSVFSFPRGAQAGLFLHHVFEQLDFTAGRNENLARVVKEGLEQYALPVRWQTVVESWIARVLMTPLDTGGSLKLGDIGNGQKLVELEFQFPLGRLQASALNVFLHRYRGEDGPQPTLEFRELQGFMKGFIDLVFEHRGRFYVLDYKSNHLGDRHADYLPRHLVRAMADSHYDLQFLIYVVALHRYLKQRLAGYDYREHMGGVYYLFLRGMRPENGDGSGVFFDCPDAVLVDELDRLFRGAGA